MFRTVTLEMSLKPFNKTDGDSIRAVCRSLFDQWRPLLKNRPAVSVMLWTGDGSEILDYAGEPSDRFEWCRYVGTANRPLLGSGERKDTSLHERKQDYLPDPPEMTYGILRSIVAAVKEEGKRAFPGAAVSVCETFDIGPEFALSDFKYDRHPEITSGAKLDSFGFIDATARLKGDARRYAAYPDGIPDGTPFGTFLGRQARVFLKDMGFDSLWLSNGLGFSAEPWSLTGKIFDGERFHPDRIDRTRREVFEFWKNFREACPEYLIQTRGTNNSAGIDYATDGVPLYDIYRAGFRITPPPNSPWAALNDDFGLELMGHMTRICELPDNSFLFRYYLHDPWWVNSPWYDRYGESAHDIYLPMAISRIDGEGKVASADRLNILSVDNSFGDMPDCCANESIPHLLKAEKDAAEAPAPLVWVYPLREYTTARSETLLKEMYWGDRLIAEAINQGLPLNCVISSDNLLRAPLSVFRASILLSPLPVNAAAAERLSEFEKKGGCVIYYGSRACAGEVPGKRFAAIEDGAAALCGLLGSCGFSISFVKKRTSKKTAAMTLAAANGGWILSAHTFDLTTETVLRFPLGAPILTGMDAEIREGSAAYRFGSCEHRECRVFVEQENGVVSCREAAPVSTVYHRKVALTGLDDATVCVFPETGDGIRVSILRSYADETPEYESGWERVNDPRYGVYYRAEHVTGDRFLLFPKKRRKE